MTAQIKVFIADDHPIFRRGLAQTLKEVSDFSIVGEADEGVSALAQIRALLPDVAVLDIDMPGQGGFEIARAIEQEKLPVRVIFLTMHNSETLLDRVLNLGVKGYVLKDGALAEIIQAIKSVMRGEEFISPALTKHLVNRLRRVEDTTNQKTTVKDLTPTELKVIRFIAQHKSSKEIAEEMFVSVRTIEQHRANIAEKLNLRGNNALLRFALEHRDELHI
ncbi:MAG: response regulator transcription factor [Acidobacteriota bacterium]|nr:response regulator transcription factor [Acidobacteriota bacterium]